jgi:hypothetical protein
VLPRRLIPRIIGAILIVVTACTLKTVYRTAETKADVKSDDPVGAWKLKCVPPDGKARECVVTVSREGEGLKGLYTADGTTRAAKSVEYAEGLLVLEVDGKFAGQTYALTYKGIPRGDALEGTVRFSFGWASGSFSFEGERIEQEVASAR